MTSAERKLAVAPNRTAVVITARKRARKNGLLKPFDRYTTAAAKKMSRTIVVRLNCFPGR